MSFTDGQKVRIIGGTVGHRVAGLVYDKEMQEYVGQVTTISETVERLDIENDAIVVFYGLTLTGREYGWAAEWLEAVEE